MGDPHMTEMLQLLEMLKTGEGSKFASFVYRSKGTGELAKLVVTLGSDTKSLYQMDLEILNAKLPTLEGLHKVACEKLIASRQESIVVGIGNNSAYTNVDTYVFPKGLSGIKIHKETGEMYVTGLVESKVTLEEGVYKVVNSKPLTLAKKELEAGLPSGKFRQYILRNIKAVSMKGETVTFHMDETVEVK
jgi:hypothetical protein